MPDKARKKTDKELAKMEKYVNKIYSEAHDDISKSWNKFMESHAPKLEKAYTELQEAMKSGDKNAIAEARDKYERTAKNITVNDKRYQAMVDETAAKLSHTNEVALSYVNNQMPKIYTTNYNAFGDQEIKGYSFSLVNENAVKELAKSDKTLLPKRKMDIPKDMKWNEKNINSQMLQGILQGESIPKMAKRLTNVTDMNRASAIRNARTMTTAAENKGRQDSFEKAQSDGVIMTREWIATNDERTRAWHADLDGVEVGVDEAWENEYGEIMYPGDPDADPANVYNCRCSIRAHVKGFKPTEEYKEEQEAVEEVSEDNTPNFVPASTIEEAEAYAKENFVVDSKWAGEGNVSFKGMSLDNANAINKELTNLFNNYDVPKFRNMGMMNFRQNIWKDAKDAPMAYRNAFNGELYFNPNILKSAKALDDYMKKGQEAFDFCINNMDRFSGKQLELVQKYKEAGRQTVADSSNNPMKAMLDHEFGHHLDHQVIMHDKDFVQVSKDGMDEYGIHLSGYALHTRGEYVAESFCAYENGLGDIDPKLAAIFDEVTK